MGQCAYFTGRGPFDSIAHPDRDHLFTLPIATSRDHESVIGQTIFFLLLVVAGVWTVKS